MKRFILSISVLSTLLLTGYYGHTAVPAPAFVSTVVVPAAKLPLSSLPAPVKSYLDQHFAGYALVRVEKVFSGGPRPGVQADSAATSRTFLGTQVRVLVNEVPFSLFFDANGAMAGTHAPGPRGNVDKSAYLTASQLPASVRDYLSKNYKGYTFLKAESHPSPTGAVRAYNVDILTSNQRADLHFDSTGTFRDAHIQAAKTSDKSVSYVSRKDLPAAIAQTLTSQYASQTYVLGEQHTGGPNGTEYTVELAANNVLTKLHFDANGNAITHPAGPGADARHDRGPQGKDPKPGPDRDRPGRDRSGHDRPTDKRADQRGPGRERPGQGGPNGPRADANRQLLLDAGALPATITSYLKANFGGYTFLKADVHQVNGQPADYATDIALGKALYKFRFASNGDVLLAEAKN